MLIVAIETSGRAGSLALCRGERGAFEVVSSSPLAGRMYSAELIPKLDDMLRENGLTARNLAGVAVVSGPGSFTGLRVGLATAKALGESLNIPIAAVSMLEALAYSVNKNGKIVTALDAQRGEAYVGEYEISDGEVCHSCESIQLVEHFLTWLKAKEIVPTVFTPDETLIERLRKEFVTTAFAPRPDAGVIAQCGLRQLLDGNTVTAEALDANYIRKSDAELFSAPKLGLV